MVAREKVGVIPNDGRLAESLQGYERSCSLNEHFLSAVHQGFKALQTENEKPKLKMELTMAVLSQNNFDNPIRNEAMQYN